MQFAHFYKSNAYWLQACCPKEPNVSVQDGALKIFVIFIIIIKTNSATYLQKQAKKLYKTMDRAKK